MKAKFLKKGIVIAALACAVVAPVQQTFAAEGLSLVNAIREVNSEIKVFALTTALADVKQETAVAPTLEIKSAKEMQFERLFKDVAFVETEEYLNVYAEADEKSESVGKVYGMSKVVIESRDEEWALVESGNVKGYIGVDALVLGRDAIEIAKTVVTENYPTTDIYTLTEEEIFGCFAVGETVEEEQARLEAEEAARIAAEKARIAAEQEAKRQRGKSVINYATQFVGNPYVYGGTSLTNGTDCSGFVKGVYRHFGISLPRTSYSLRSVGVRVSYSEMQPGDIVCYSGHVALYMGDGQIVHAANSRDGIKISDVDYARIITIRRVL